MAFEYWYANSHLYDTQLDWDPLWEAEGLTWKKFPTLTCFVSTFHHPQKAPSILPHCQIPSSHLEQKKRKGTEELKPTTTLAWEPPRGFVWRKVQRFSKDGYETESFCGNFSLPILSHFSSLEVFLFSFEKGIRDRSLKGYLWTMSACVCSSSSPGVMFSLSSGLQHSSDVSRHTLSPLSELWPREPRINLP